MTTVITCSNLAEAQMLKALLDDTGLPAFLPDEITANSAPLIFPKNRANSAAVAFVEADAFSPTTIGSRARPSLTSRTGSAMACAAKSRRARKVRAETNSGFI